MQHLGKKELVHGGGPQTEMHANLHRVLAKPPRRWGLGWTSVVARCIHAGKRLGEWERGRMCSQYMEVEVGE